MADQIEWREVLVEHCKIEECFFEGKMVGWLQPRPAYCDRGHWQVNLEFPDIDGADGFPRYYMSREVAKSETEAFLLWRLLKVRVASG